jgi:short-subunit dehydrogenase
MKILITGAASGFGRGAALELARRGHEVTAGVHVAPQATNLLSEAAEAGVTVETIVLDITSTEDQQYAARREVDVLINNAGVMEAGPVAEIPLRRVRHNFDVNVFGTLGMCQAFAPQMVARGAGKIINVTSMGGLVTVPFAAVYTATKHALESLTEGLKAELAGTGVEICTVNPGLFGTGFNDRGAETMSRWFDPASSLSRPELLAGLSAGLEGQLDPAMVIDALVTIAEERSSKFRNVLPVEIIPWIRAIQERTWDASKDDSLAASSSPDGATSAISSATRTSRSPSAQADSCPRGTSSTTTSKAG